MPAKKKSTKADASKKEELPDPASVKNGVSTTFIGGWSAYETIESVREASRQVVSAHTGPDGVVATPLPRTNVLLLPTPEDAADDAAQTIFTVEVADQLFVEGVTRQQCAQAQSLVKTWPPAPAAATESAEETAAAAAASAEQTVPPEATAEPPEQPYADALDDERYAQVTAVGPSYAARDVVIRGRCFIEGVAPSVVVPPRLPEKPNLDAVTLDPPTAGEGAAGDAAPAAKPKKAAAKDKKGKQKLTPEQLEELERKKAALEAQYLQQTEEAVQLAREESDYLMTFAHPNRWVHVVFRHMTFAGPVEVRRAHVSFQDCRFVCTTADPAVAARPLLLVSQYCHVQCSKCSFEAPQRCGIYALPSAHVEVRKCLFSGVSQDALWAARLPGVSPQSTSAAGAGADAGDDEAGADPASPSNGADSQAGEHKSSTALAFPVVISGDLKDAAQSALADRSAAVGVQTDSAKLLLHSCDFICLGVGVYVKGSYTGYITRHKVAPKSAQQLAPEACDTSLDGNSFHHFANAALLLDRSARLVSIRHSFVEACAYYGLDCQGGASSVLVRQNFFATDAAVRIREGATVALMHNDFQSIPRNDNSLENPCLQPVY